MVGGIIPLRRATSSRYDGRLGQESASSVFELLPSYSQPFDKLMIPLLFCEDGIHFRTS